MPTQRSRRGKSRPSATQLSIPIPIPVSSGVSLPALVTCRGAGSIRLRWRRRLRLLEHPASSSLERTSRASPANLWHGCPRRNTSSDLPTKASRSSSRTPRARLASFTPNLTPVYALTDLDFIDEKGNKDPVQVERADVFSLPTIQRVEVMSRGKSIFRGPGRGARSKPDRDLRPARRIDHPGARDLRRVRYGAADRPDDLAARALCPNQVHLQAVLGILPARSDGHRHHHRCEPRPVELSGSDHRDRGGRQGPARLHLRGACRRRLEPGLQSERTRDRLPAELRRPRGPGQHAADLRAADALTNGVAQIWLGASGIGGGGQSQWGGANVYVSVDGVTYSQVATCLRRRSAKAS